MLSSPGRQTGNPVYFNIRFFELGFSLCNLFELAGDKELMKKPDGVFVTEYQEMQSIVYQIFQQSFMKMKKMVFL